jgi:L-rhamnose isomerase/sugar isomerase
VDRAQLAEHRNATTARAAAAEGTQTDVEPVGARHRAGGAIDPVAAYRASGYRQRAAEKRPASTRVGVGIV